MATRISSELARTEFALNIVTSIDEQRKIEQVLPQLIAEGKAMESANANNSFIRDKFEQHDFQSNINNEIIQDENVLIEKKENDNLIVAPEEEVGIGQ